MKKRNILRSVRVKATAIGLLAVCASLMAGCAASSPQAADTEGDAAPRIKVETVGRAVIGEPREQIAEVSASMRSDVFAESGGILVKLLKRSGERVEAGDAIAEFESKNGRIERERARAALKNAESSLSLSTAELSANRLQLANTVEKLQNLLKQQTIDGVEGEALNETKRSLQAAMKQLDALNGDASISALESQVEAARLALEQAESAWNGGRLIAPASGVLTDVKAEEGMTVQPGSLFGIVQNTDKVRLKAQLTEASAQLVQGKKELAFMPTGGEGSPRKATVIHLAEVPDAATRLYALELEADNSDGSLKPASRAHLQLTTPEEENVLVVPSLGVVREGRDTFVFVANGSQAEKREVRLGRINGTVQEVLSGLQEGERLIVSGQHALEDGQSIQP
ncbi:efflux RND transporter periplasmic adaptor subunit [Cohnella hongkongensis]|uniref:Efflux RND transporter periplasmic adaptor subunit n=1 Tax=Cohnella hongkongensis TaxID=178337 RepID=A0ABV9FAQ1_9BACL